MRVERTLVGSRRDDRFRSSPGDPARLATTSHPFVGSVTARIRFRRRSSARGLPGRPGQTPPRGPPPSPPPPPIPALIPTPPPTGDRFIGKYRIKSELGRGGMGAVYLAEQPGLGREGAIKELIQSAAADPVALQRFLQEAQVMARTSHPNLVQVHDLELMGTANYIILEFVRGKSLREWLVRGPLAPPHG